MLAVEFCDVCHLYKSLIQSNFLKPYSRKLSPDCVKVPGFHHTSFGTITFSIVLLMLPVHSYICSIRGE